MFDADGTPQLQLTWIRRLSEPSLSLAWCKPTWPVYLCLYGCACMARSLVRFVGRACVCGVYV